MKWKCTTVICLLRIFFFFFAIFFFHFNYTCIAHIFIELISLVRSHFFLYFSFADILLCNVIFHTITNLKKILYRFFLFYSHKNWKEGKARKKMFNFKHQLWLVVAKHHMNEKKEKNDFFMIFRALSRDFFCWEMKNSEEFFSIIYFS